MLGNHDKCDNDYYCDTDHKNNLPEIEISEDARENLNKYMQHFADRGEKIQEGMTSNIVECFFSVNNKF